MKEYPIRYLELAERTAAYRGLRAAFAADAGKSSYLLSSPDTLLSECVALRLAAEEKGKDSALFSRIAGGRCADVRTMGDDGFMAENADEVVAGCVITPGELRRKYYVLNLTKTNEAAQNKLLKTLEEAPDCSVFFLVVPNRNALLPTVLSRLEEVSPCLPEDAELPMNEFSPYAALAAYGGKGNLTEFDGLMRGTKAPFLLAAVNFMKAIADDRQLRAASALPQKREEMAETLGYIERILGDIMKAACGLRVETHGLYDMKEMTEKFPLGCLPEALDAVRRAVRRTAGGKLVSVADTLAITVSEVKNA